MKKQLTFVSNILIYLSLLTLVLLGVPTTMAQGPWPGPVQLISPVQPGQSSAFIGAGIEAHSSLSGSSQLLGNPGFESGDWSPWEPFGAPALDSNTRHSGGRRCPPGCRSARLGHANNAGDQLVQMVTVPAGASAVTIDFWYRLATGETNLEADFFCYGLWDQSGNTAFVVHCRDLGAAGDQAWGQETYSLTADERAGVVGQTALMAFILQTNVSSPSQGWVDDTALLISTPGSNSDYWVYLPFIFRPQPPPTIVSFTANPATIAPGGSSVLSWQVNGATGLSVSPDVGPVTGSSVSVSPATTTQYTLTASNAAGSTTAQTTVTVSGGGGSAAAFWLPYTSAAGDLLPTYGANVAVDSAGGIHLGYAIHTGLDNGQRPAYYAYCAALACNNSRGRFLVTNTASGAPATIGDAYFSLRVDTNGQPRIALYTGETVTPPLQLTTLHYLWCNADCLTPNADTWHLVSPGLPTYHGQGVDLVLDPANRPRLAYEMGGEGLGYAWCNANCEGASNWQTRTVESTEAIIAQYPPGLPQHQKTARVQGCRGAGEICLITFLPCSPAPLLPCLSLQG